MFVKIAPDLDVDEIDAIAAIAAAPPDRRRDRDQHDARARRASSDRRHATEAGGLSGAPLARAVQRGHRPVCAHALGAGVPDHRRRRRDVGRRRASPSVDAGADLVQIYTGLIYKGPALVTESARALARP